MTQENSAKVSFILVVFLGMLTAITPLATDLYLPALPIMPGELNTTASNIQMTIGVMTFGVAFGQLFGGPISDTMGRKVPLIIGNLLCVISGLICAYAPSIDILLLGRFLQGLTGSVGVVIAKAIARDFASGQELTKLFAMLMMVNGLAPVLAPLVGGQLLLITTWRFIFIILAVFSAILLLGSLLFRESLPKEKRVTGGLATAIKNYFTLIFNSLLSALSLPISQVHPLYTKIFSNFQPRNLVIFLVSIAAALSWPVPLADE